MANYKGTTIKTIHKLLAARGPETEKVFVETLSPAARKVYTECLANSWMPIEVGAEIMAKGAERLFPGDPEALRKVGLANARETLRGIYRIFLKIPTLEYILKRLATIWQTFFDQGQTTLEDFQGNRGVLVVRNFPDYPAALRESICGFIVGLLELTGAKDIQVRKQEDDPMAWKWHVSWR